jgi:transposase
MLEHASVRLSSVAGSLINFSVRTMLCALFAGEHDPRVLAEPAKGRMRRRIPQLTEAPTGHFNAGHAELARSMLTRIELIEIALAELNAVIAAAFQPWAHQLELLRMIPGWGRGSRS